MDLPSPTRGTEPGGRAWAAVMLLVSAALVATLWAVPYVPTNDGPQHVLSAYIENHFDDPGAPYARFLALLPQFAARGFALIFLPLEAALGFRRALPVAQSLMALGVLWGFALLVLALARRSPASSPQRRFAAPLGAVVALPWSFYMGFFPGVVGAALGLFILAFALWRPVWTLPRRVIAGGLLALQAVAHVFSAGVTGVVLLALAVASAPRGARLREAGLTAAMGVPAGVVFALSLLDTGKLAGVAASHDVTWLPWSERLAGLPGTLAPGAAVRALLALALALAAAAAVLARARRAAADRAELVLAVLAPLFIGLSLLLPRDVPGWQFFSPRFAGLGLTFGLALVDPGSQRRLRAGAAAIPVLLAVASLGLSLRLHRTLAAGCADLLAGLGRDLPRGGFLLPLVLDHTCAGLDRGALARAVPHLDPVLHIGALYAADAGAAQPYLFMGTPSAHALTQLARGRAPLAPSTEAWLELTELGTRDPAHRARALTGVVPFGVTYDRVLVYGATPADVQLFVDRGYVPLFREGTLLLARYEPCGAALELPGRDGDAPVLLELSVPPLEAPVDSRVLPPSASPRRVPLLGGLCGRVRVRVVWDEDRSRSLTPGDVACEGSDAEGRLDGEITRARPSLACRAVSR